MSSLTFDEDEPQPDPELGVKFICKIVNTSSYVDGPSGPTIYTFNCVTTITYKDLMEMNGGGGTTQLRIAGSDAILVILPPKGSDPRPDNAPGAGT